MLTRKNKKTTTKKNEQILKAGTNKGSTGEQAVTVEPTRNERKVENVLEGGGIQGLKGGMRFGHGPSNENEIQENEKRIKKIIGCGGDS